jgi:hypothetical protein
MKILRSRIQTQVRGFKSHPGAIRRSLANEFKTYIVTKAPRENLEEYEDYLVALHRLNDKNDRVVSEKELVKVGR